ncbi:GDP dissociation inhibitor [Hyaloraphidium curvatum]|nr:GDP dissociation inhibitor [Hyaloraphidium curvatum]
MADEADSYDLAVLGTGVLECIIASAAALSGLSVVQIDANRFYGSRDAAFDFRSLLQLAADASAAAKEQPAGHVDARGNFLRSFDQIECYVSDALHSGAEEQMLREAPADAGPSAAELALAMSNGVPELGALIEELLSRREEAPLASGAVPLQNRARTLSRLFDRSRSFNIELYPRLFFATGVAVDLLLASGVNNYMEFKALESASVRWGESLRKVPVSKEDIFGNEILGLLEKRALMKSLRTVGEMEDIGIDENATTHGTFEAMLSHQGLSLNLVRVLSDSVASTLDLTGNVSVREGVLGTRRYLKSLGRYGPTPFLCPAYGGGSEMAQGFSRLCAVHGGTYMLDQPVRRLSAAPDGATHAIDVELSGGRIVHAKRTVASLDYADLGGGNSLLCDETFVSRCIVLTDRPLQSDSELDLVVLPGRADSGAGKVLVLQVSASNHTAPPGIYALHFFCLAEATARGDLLDVVRQFVDTGSFGNPGWYTSSMRSPCSFTSSLCLQSRPLPRSCPRRCSSCSSGSASVSTEVRPRPKGPLSTCPILHLQPISRDFRT